MERNGREQSKRPAEWALGSQSNTAGSNAREVIGKGARSGYLPRILVFFFTALAESVCQENKSDESRK